MKIKTFLSGFLTLGIIGIPFLILISGGKTQPTFWNYEQNISPEEESNLRNDIGYNTFGDLDELEAAIYGNKVIAGISSDYQAVKLANDNIIQPIDFKLLWNLDGETPEELGPQLQKIYTPFAFEALDKAFTLNDQGGQKRYLWQYVLPYFIQEKVIAFDIRKGTWSEEEKVQLDTPEGINQLFDNKSYKGILNKLQTKGYHRITINDYIRDNMMIGSEISTGGFNSLPTSDSYKEYIDNFKATIENQDGFGQQITSNNVSFNTDGTAVLQDLIDPSKYWDTAILYNGDALDAYNAIGHFPSLKDNHFVRVVFPTNPIYLTDTLIIPSYIQGDLKAQTYRAIKNYLYNNGNVTTLDDVDLHDPGEQYPILINFDFIAYSVPYEIYDKAIKDRYFIDQESEVEDKIAKYIYSITSPPSTDYKKYFAQEVDDALFTSMLYYYIMMKN